MSTKLPLDVNDNPIPALRFKSGAAHQITSGASSARNTTAFADTTRVIGLYTTQDAYLAFGDSSVTATTSDHFFPAGVYYDIALGGDGSAHHDYLAVLQVASGGTVYVSEKE